MVNVEFQEENSYTSRQILGERVVPGMVGALTKMGLAKNSQQAKYILLGVIVISLSLTILLFYRALTSGPRLPTQAEINAADTTGFSFDEQF